MSVLRKIDTIKELVRLIGLQLKSDGHSKYSNHILLTLSDLSLNYEIENAQDCLIKLMNFQEELKKTFKKFELSKAMQNLERRVLLETERLMELYKNELLL